MPVLGLSACQRAHQPICNTHGCDAQRLPTFFKGIRVELTYPLVKNSAGELVKVVKTVSGLAHWDDSQNYKNLETDQWEKHKPRFLKSDSSRREEGYQGRFEPIGPGPKRIGCWSKDKLEVPAPTGGQSGKVVGKAKGKPKGEDSQPPHGFGTVYDYFDRSKPL